MIRHSHEVSESWKNLNWKKFRKDLFRLQKRVFSELPQIQIEKTREDAQKAREKTGAGSGGGSWNPLDLSSELINSAIQGFVYVILSGVSAAFQYIVQLSFLMIAFAAPSSWFYLYCLSKASLFMLGWLAG